MMEWFRRPRFVFCGLVICGLFVLPLAAKAQQQRPLIDPEASAVNEQTLLRQAPRIEGQVVIPDKKEGVLIQPAGREWRYFHEVILRWIVAIAIIGTLAALLAAYLVLGPIRLSHGRSGRKVIRFDPFERFLHWMTAFSFIVLGITGLNMTFGKVVLMPLVGPDAFSKLSEAAKYAHDFLSFPFVLGIVLIATLWLKDNILENIDLEWLRQGGGFIKSKHPPARRFNAGEKLVFWLALGAGLALTASGYLLLFPFYVTDIFGMQIAEVVHGITAMLFIALILGHIYIGTIGMEGAFEAMWTGEVDLNWAKEHHNLWLEEEQAKAEGAGQAHLSSSPAE
jgi:formate dehydrogenase subunit gamma